MVETVDQVAAPPLTQVMDGLVHQPNQSFLAKSQSVYLQTDENPSSINANATAMTFTSPEIEDDLGSRQISAKRKRDATAIIWTEGMKAELISSRQNKIQWAEVVVRVSKVAGREISQNSCINKLMEIAPDLVGTYKKNGYEQQRKIKRVVATFWTKAAEKVLTSSRQQGMAWEEVVDRVSEVAGKKISQKACGDKLKKLDKNLIVTYKERVVWTEEMEVKLISFRRQRLPWTTVVYRLSEIAGREVSLDTCFNKLKKIAPDLVATYRKIG